MYNQRKEARPRSPILDCALLVKLLTLVTLETLFKDRKNKIVAKSRVLTLGTMAPFRNPRENSPVQETHASTQIPESLFPEQKKKCVKETKTQKMKVKSKITWRSFG